MRSASIASYGIGPTRPEWDLEPDSTPNAGSRSFKAVFPHNLFVRNVPSTVLLEPFLCLGD